MSDITLRPKPYEPGEPATDVQLKAIKWASFREFDAFPCSTAMSQMATCGIRISGEDLMVLGAAIAFLHTKPNLYAGRESRELEHRIVELSNELVDLLARTQRQQGRWRAVRGEEDWDDLDADLPNIEPEASVDVEKLVEDLTLLVATSNDRLSWLRTSKDIGVGPQSNRAPRKRYFYWMLLLAFWRYRLGRELGTSVTPEGKSSGPLITFIRVMSQGEMKPDAVKGTTIRAFIRRFSSRVVQFQSFFPTCHY